MKTSRCLLFFQDTDQSSLLGLTLREYGIHFRTVEKIEMLGPLSEGCPTLAWFIDLDSIEQSVTEITALARRIVPDSKIVFLSSRFTTELAQECLRERAVTLLVKPVQIPRLVQCISSFRQEPELLDQDDFLEVAQEVEPQQIDHPDWDVNSLLQKLRVTCPVCAHRFESFRFCSWKFHITEVDSDFCPAYPKNVFPELHLICVCPKCLYANQVGRFERFALKDKERDRFLDDPCYLPRREIAGDLDFTGERGFAEGFASFRLAQETARELQFGDLDSYFGELLLKTTWLCRRMGKKQQEQDVQREALDHYTALFRPYERSDGFFPKKSEIQAMLPRGKVAMADRTVIFTGFVVAELARRLGIMDRARAAFAEVSKIPFLPIYHFLSQHIKRAIMLLDDPNGWAASAPEKSRSGMHKVRTQPSANSLLR